MTSLISTFTIAADEEGTGRSKARLASCAHRSDPGFPSRLVHHKNYRGRSYEENHLEEWIAREPASLFGKSPVLLLASQNYIHLRAKIDLLFIDLKNRVFPVELKVVPVAKNGGVVPYDLYERQMRPYVEFLTGFRNIEQLEFEYSRFIKAFTGTSRTLAGDLTATLGRPSVNCPPAEICEVYVAEGFDAYSLEYFERRSSEDGRNVRLISYKFFPSENYIEFLNMYETREEKR